ncbi:hypothetical protein [Altericista sp. CCNU0014]
MGVGGGARSLGDLAVMAIAMGIARRAALQPKSRPRTAAGRSWAQLQV